MDGWKEGVGKCRNERGDLESWVISNMEYIRTIRRGFANVELMDASYTKTQNTHKLCSFLRLYDDKFKPKTALLSLGSVCPRLDR